MEEATPISSGPVFAPSLQVAVYDHLRKMIRTGEFASLEVSGGLKLRDLAAHLGVSTMPLREALRRLEAEGLIAFSRSDGIRQTRLSARSFAEIADMRVVLEGLAMARALDRMRPEDLDRARALCRQMDKPANTAEWRRLNHEFHAAIYAAGDYKRLLSTVENLWVLVEPYLRIYTSGIRNLAAAQDEHRQLIAAIAAGDRSSVLSVVEQHIRRSERAILSDPENAPFVLDAL